MAGNDLRKMSAQTTAILTNREVIAVDQDRRGVEGFRYRKQDSLETWLKPLTNDEWAVCFLNRSPLPRTVYLNWQEELISDTLSHAQLNAQTTTYRIYDLWTSKDLGTTKKPLRAVVPPHDVLMVRLRR